MFNIKPIIENNAIDNISLFKIPPIDIAMTLKIANIIS